MSPLNLQFETVDAFTSIRFSGNQASVIVLPSTPTIDDETLQKIAAEFNLSETAFSLPLEDSTEINPHYNLRWFTPESFVKLCGHATLASAHVLFKLHPIATTITFETLSGTLLAKRYGDDGQILLNFPADHTTLNTITSGEDYELAISQAIKSAPSISKDKILGVAQTSKFIGMGILIELDNSIDLESLQVDCSAFEYMTFTQAAPISSPHAIYSRFFGPGLGVIEDPVTGSAHAYIAPYWLGNSSAYSRLNQSFTSKTLFAKQVSKRGGEMEIVWNKESGRVDLIGRAITVMKGTLF